MSENVRSAAQVGIRCRAGDVDRQRHERNHEQHLEPDMHQDLVTTDEGQEQETQRHGRSDRGHVIENEMQMSGVQDEERRHVPRYGTR